ncbi:hypothetical protein FACS1894200_06910 [Spirochaetia bacterium]|nr:hypothetical protein FACS1894200_06910 [Spirochaetia bacterium]
MSQTELLLKEVEGLSTDYMAQIFDFINQLKHRTPPAEKAAVPMGSNRWMRGCCQDSGDTMEAYFERKRRDKEEELAQEQRQAEERTRHAKIPS